MNTGKASSRFIPTLTEVVQSAPEAVSDSSRELVEEVMQAMLPKVEAQLRASLQSSIETQVREAIVHLEEPMQRAIQEVLARRNIR